jgi:hypothetical protein
MSENALTAEGYRQQLADLAAEINALHEHVVDGARQTLKHAMHAGDLLIKARKAAGYGNWVSWVKANCAFSHSTSEDYVWAARHRAEIEAKILPHSEHAPNLSIRGARRLLAPPTPAPVSSTTAAPPAAPQVWTAGQVSAAREHAISLAKESLHSRADPGCADCKGEGLILVTVKGDSKLFKTACPCTKTRRAPAVAPTISPEPTAGNDVDPEQSADAHRDVHAAEEAERELIIMRYAEGAKTYAALFKPPVIKAEHIAAACEAAKAWEAVAEALSERMTAEVKAEIAREAAATTVTEEFPEFPPSLLRPKPEPKKNSDAEAAA